MKDEVKAKAPRRQRWLNSVSLIWLWICQWAKVLRGEGRIAVTRVGGSGFEAAQGQSG